MTPGCRQLAVTPVELEPARELVGEQHVGELGRARRPGPDRSAARSADRRSRGVPPWWAPDETFTIRDGAPAVSRSSSRLVSRKYARWLTANCISRPSTVTSPLPGDDARVVDQHVKLGCAAADGLGRFADGVQRGEIGTTTTSARGAPCGCRSSLATRSPPRRRRHSRPGGRRAPASRSAGGRPMPRVAPVIDADATAQVRQGAPGTAIASAAPPRRRRASRPRPAEAPGVDPRHGCAAPNVCPAPSTGRKRRRPGAAAARRSPSRSGTASSSVPCTMSHGTAIARPRPRMSSAAGVALDVVEHVGILRQDLAGTSVLHLFTPAAARRPLRRRPALDRGDRGPGRPARRTRGVGRPLKHGDAAAARVAQQAQTGWAARRPARRRASASTTRRRSCNSAENVLCPKRSGKTNSPVSSTPLPLRLKVTAENPARARRSANGGHNPQSLNPLNPWTTTTAGRGDSRPPGAHVDQDVAQDTGHAVAGEGGSGHAES